jgi:hypothetical protein
MVVIVDIIEAVFLVAVVDTVAAVFGYGCFMYIFGRTAGTRNAIREGVQGGACLYVHKYECAYNT